MAPEHLSYSLRSRPYLSDHLLLLQCNVAHSKSVHAATSTSPYRESIVSLGLTKDEKAVSIAVAVELPHSSFEYSYLHRLVLRRRALRGSPASSGELTSVGIQGSQRTVVTATTQQFMSAPWVIDPALPVSQEQPKHPTGSRLINQVPVRDRPSASTTSSGSP